MEYKREIQYKFWKGKHNTSLTLVQTSFTEDINGNDVQVKEWYFPTVTMDVATWIDRLQKKGYTVAKNVNAYGTFVTITKEEWS